MSTRKPLIAGNWKLHKTRAESKAFAEGLKAQAASITGADLAVAPVFTSVGAVAETLAGTKVITLGQNMHWEAQGAFTGEVSAPLLKDAGAGGVILGHSERRSLFGEDDAGVLKKLKAALSVGLLPIVCVGETLAEREAGKTLDVVLGQFTSGLEGLSAEELGPTVIAYEPVWAIGTGRTASPDDAQDVHRAIRERAQKALGNAFADRLRILYGGSVKPDNAGELLAKPDIDGALVGGASLALDSFVAIARAAR